MDATVAGVVTELKWAYGFLGFITMTFSIGGAWAIFKYRVQDNIRRIGNLEESRKAMYTQINAQGESIAAANAKLDILVDNLKKQ